MCFFEFLFILLCTHEEDYLADVFLLYFYPIYLLAKKCGKKQIRFEDCLSSSCSIKVFISYTVDIIIYCIPKIVK